MLDSKNKKTNLSVLLKRHCNFNCNFVNNTIDNYVCFVHLCSCQHKYFSSILKYHYIFCNIIKYISTHSRKMSAFTGKNSLSSMVTQTSDCWGFWGLFFHWYSLLTLAIRAAFETTAFIQSALPEIIDTYHNCSSMNSSRVLVECYDMSF